MFCVWSQSPFPLQIKTFFPHLGDKPDLDPGDIPFPKLPWYSTRALTQVTCSPPQMKAFASLREEGLGRFTVTGSSPEWAELSPVPAHRLCKSLVTFPEEKACERLGTLLWPGPQELRTLRPSCALQECNVLVSSYGTWGPLAQVCKSWGPVSYPRRRSRFQGGCLFWPSFLWKVDKKLQKYLCSFFS